MKQRVKFEVIVPEEFSERIELKQCPICGKHEDNWTRRKDWRCCSKKCTEEYDKIRLINDWNSLRMKAIIRDNYMCVKCGFRGFAFEFIGDHIIPIALGGEEFDINNVQTLCKKCDKIKTSEDLKKIAKQRRVEKSRKNNMVLYVN